MPEERTGAGKRPFTRDHAQSEARLDRERAIAELQRYLDLAVREMGLEISFEISTPATVGGSADDKDVLVAFTGADQDFLLEHNADLLLALEHVGHRWLRLDPRLHDRVRFDCGDYRALRLEELKLSARERRLIHLELSGAQGVRTMSEGVGDRRQLVVYPVVKK